MTTLFGGVKQDVYLPIENPYRPADNYLFYPAPYTTFPDEDEWIAQRLPRDGQFLDPGNIANPHIPRRPPTVARPPVNLNRPGQGRPAVAGTGPQAGGAGGAVWPILAGLAALGYLYLRKKGK